MFRYLVDIEQWRESNRLLRRNSRRGKTASAKPPINAEFMFHLFMTPQNCEAFVGDLEERYKLVRKKFGRRRRNLWYWTQTVASLAPIIWAWAKKVGMKPVAALVACAVARGMVGNDSWLPALVDLWKRMRL